MLFHLDNDFLVYALGMRGPERKRLYQLIDEGAKLEMSAIAWYEFARGPRLPEQLARVLDLLSDDGIIVFDASLATEAGNTFRLLGSPRKRAQDIAIGVTARSRGARLLTRNARDFSGIEGLSVEGVKGAG
jgi:predicted nucleic acid-binding protein